MSRLSCKLLLKFVNNFLSMNSQPNSKMSGYFREGSVRPWPNDSIFHSIFSSTFDLKVERLFSVVEHMWPNGSIFRSTFQLLIFPQRMSAKNIYHHKYLPA